eukprot:scaffold169_cov149-Ochromonas_danica.AAC.1
MRFALWRCWTSMLTRRLGRRSRIRFRTLWVSWGKKVEVVRVREVDVELVPLGRKPEHGCQRIAFVDREELVPVGTRDVVRALPKLLKKVFQPGRGAGRNQGRGVEDR